MHLVETKKDDAVPVSEKYMLTIKEAVAYFNIGIMQNLNNNSAHS